MTDFRAANILVKLKDVDNLSEEDFATILEPPRKVEVRTRSGKESSLIPSYLVNSTDIGTLNGGNIRTYDNEIRVVDFGESYFLSSPPGFLEIPEHYLPPEAIINGGIIGVGCDLWALGCTIYEIQVQVPLFYMLTSTDELLAEMVYLFGKLPRLIWDGWEGNSEYFNEDGSKLPKNAVGMRPADFSNIDGLLRPKKECWLSDGTYREFNVPEKDKPIVQDLLLKIFRYPPGRCLPAKEVVEDKWFKI